MSETNKTSKTPDTDKRHRGFKLDPESNRILHDQAKALGWTETAVLRASLREFDQTHPVTPTQPSAIRELLRAVDVASLAAQKVRAA